MEEKAQIMCLYMFVYTWVCVCVYGKLIYSSSDIPVYCGKMNIFYDNYLSRKDKIGFLIYNNHFKSQVNLYLHI